MSTFIGYCVLYYCLSRAMFFLGFALFTGEKYNGQIGGVDRSFIFIPYLGDLFLVTNLLSMFVVKIYNLAETIISKPEELIIEFVNRDRSNKREYKDLYRIAKDNPELMRKALEEVEATTNKYKY